MRCPRCGSDHVSIRAETETTTTERVKGFGWIKACLGWLLFSIPGILCGLCGMGKGRVKTSTVTKMVNVCQNCGQKF